MNEFDPETWKSLFSAIVSYLVIAAAVCWLYWMFFGAKD